MNYNLDYPIIGSDNLREDPYTNELLIVHFNNMRLVLMRQFFLPYTHAWKEKAKNALIIPAAALKTVLRNSVGTIWH